MSNQSAVDVNGLPAECDVCHRILSTLSNQKDWEYYQDLGLFKVVCEQDCPVHVPLFRDMLEGAPSISELTRAYITYTSRGDEVAISIDNPPTTLVPSKVCGVYRLASTSGDDTSTITVERLVNNQWLDPALPKRWKNKCISEHGNECDTPLGRFSELQSSPAWLIDVHNNCIIPGQPGIKYVCLSYVWGTYKGLRLVKSNVLLFRCPGALKTVWDNIPLTVKHALAVVKLLGESYLWVDAFCIAQDNEQQTMHEIQNMAAIYAGAEVTIIAAGGNDADAGLRGLPYMSNQRTCVKKTYPFGTKLSLVQPLFLPYHASPAQYYSRGWTFQEYIFSKRRLIFENHSLRWECNRCSWYEDMLESNGPVLELSLPWNWKRCFKIPYFSLRSYNQIVQMHIQRKFTYEEDVLSSFLGLSNQLSQHFQCHFLCGLPEVTFDAALLWTPMYRWQGERARLRRRVSSRQSACISSLALLPSWSWMGWQGEISWWPVYDEYVKRGHINDLVCNTPGYLVNITKWYTASSPSYMNSRKVEMKDFRQGMGYVDSGCSLPAGWTGHEHNGEISVEVDHLLSRSIESFSNPAPIGHSARFYFIHEDVPDVQFWYPIPVPQSTNSFTPLPQTQYLLCETERTWLCCVPRTQRQRDKFLAHSLVDDSGHIVGSILLQQAEDFHLIDHTCPPGPLLELVAISMSVRRFKTVYNVLWVEWQNGIAYRRALGKVRKDAWEAQERKKVSLVLG